MEIKDTPLPETTSGNSTTEPKRRRRRLLSSPGTSPVNAVPQLTRQDLIDLIKAAREPNELEKLRMEREIAKEKEEADRKEMLRQEMVNNARIEMEGRERIQSNCGHRKERGESAVMGQIHSDGLYHPLCLRCGKEFKPIVPPREFLAQGVMTD